MDNELSVNINALTAEFNANVEKSISKLDKFANNALKIGGAMTLGVTTPLLLLARQSANLFDIQATAISQVEAGLKSTQGQVGFTSKALQQMASDLQNNSMFGDESILKDVTAQLLTFTGITGEQFKRTEQAAIDLATRLDGDLKGSAIQLGKALNDPVANLSALSRSGIQFSESQKELINSLVETNRLADAQNVILDELEKQYGGSAAAAAAAGTGGWTQLSNIIGDIKEEFGGFIVEALKPLIGYVKESAIWFQSLSPEVKKTILVVAGLAAAIGPVLLGFAAVAPMIPYLVAGFTALTAAAAPLIVPILAIGAAVAATAALIYHNWESIKKTLTDNYFFQGFSNLFKGAFGIVTSLFDVFSNILQGNWMDAGNALLNVWKSVWNMIIGATQAALGTIGKGIAQFLDFMGATDFAKSVSHGVDAFVKMAEDSKFQIDKVENRISALAEFLKSTDLPVTVVPVKIETVKGEEVQKEKSWSDLNVGELEGIDKINAQQKRFAEEFAKILDIDPDKIAKRMSDSMAKVIPKVENVFGDAQESIKSKINQFKDAIRPFLENSLGVLADVMAQGFASMFNQDIKFDSKKMIAQVLSAVGDMLISIAVPLVAALALGNVATFGGMSIEWGAAIGLLAAGAAMKGGGMALGSGSSSPSSSGQLGGYNSAPSFQPQQSSSYGMQPIKVEFANGALQGYFNEQTQRRGR
jgi:hypothetical protein